MSNMKVTDDWLYQYMPVVDEALIRGIEDSTDYEYQFSEQFEKKMEQLIRRENRDAQKGRWKAFTGRLMQSVRMSAGYMAAAAACAVLLILTGVLMGQQGSGDKAGSAPVRENQGAGADFLEKSPACMPEGYRLVSEQEDATSYEMVYENDMGIICTLRQETEITGSTVAPGSDFRRKESVQLEGALIEIYWYEDGSSYSYCVYENCAYIVEAEQLSAEEIEEIYTNWIY